MLDNIKKKYDSYIYIHETVLHTLEGNEDSELAKTLLENSLYLSVFTTFESFLKDLIDNYNENKTNTGVKFSNLSNSIAYSIFKSKQRHIENVFGNNESNNINAFNSFFIFMNNDLCKQTLQEHIRFEFLHKEKLDGHYKNIFEEVLGDKEFLTNLEINQSVSNFGEELDEVVVSNASTFLYNYTNKIRNNIAHKNEGFQINENFSFKSIVDTFFTIIKRISEKYEEHTGFQLDRVTQHNLLDV